jgi:hypothetical protein
VPSLSADAGATEYTRTLARALGLHALVAARLSASPGVRIARVLGWLVSLVFGSAILVLWPRMHGALADVVAVRALKWLSWLGAGLACFSTARDLWAAAEADGTAALAAQRGFSRDDLGRTQWIASMTTIARATLGPGLLLVGLVLVASRSMGELARRALFGLGAISYLVVLAMTLGALGRVSVWISARRARSLLVVLVLGPYLLERTMPELGGVAAWANRWLDWLRGIGVGFG